MKKMIIAVALLMVWQYAFAAQEGTFTASVDRNRVAMGEQFQITFTLEGSAGGKDFRPPSFNDFLTLSGPNQSTSMQFVNGTMSSSISYTYVLQPRSEGKFTIGPATTEYGGKRLQTQPVTIEVTKGAPQAKQQGSQSQDSDIGKQIGDNLFLKIIVDKSRVYQGEQVTATYKIYSRIRLANLSMSKLPALTGFWSEDLEQIKQIQFSSEVVNGKQYNVATLKKVALFPQRSGTLTLDPMEVSCIVQVQNRKRSNDIFDQFFNDPFFGNFSNVNYKVESEPLKITVMPLPVAGATNAFGGAVGKFSIEAWLDKHQTKTNEAVTLKVKISGRGNLKLLGAPAINVPPDLERYDPKISDNITREGDWIAGSRTFEYLLIPRHAGVQKIPSFPFTFFDVEKKNYVTLRSPEFSLSVGKGSEIASGLSPGMSKEDVQLLGEDIRFIKSGNVAFRRRGEMFVGSPAFFALSCSPVLAFIGFVFYVKRREKQLGDIISLRNRKARKVARQRLVQANKFLHQKKKEEFYAEVSRALWGYVADKLGIPPADLSADAARASLESRGISPDLAGELVTTIQQCEFARFAPSSDSIRMDGIYREAVKLISSIEDQI